ncbi:unnamed protein product [Allacma fusca]|uniref:Uncharacterized protein n=1 Tax=Allacma fusca TaxID=39272 RepID=A0A8J2PUP6_9HEXA|nr:unnamed protein product [Allacma fusca]
MASLRRIPVLIQTSQCFFLGNISNPQLRLAHSNGWTRFMTTRGCATSSSNPNTSSFSFDDKSAKNSASSPTTPDRSSSKSPL